ncbi:MAG: DUF1289 domain-containing protein [Kiloniellaceae bacterium]
MTDPAPTDRRDRRREGRRRVRRLTFDTSVASPCIRICQLDDTTGLCIGCHRAIDEIRDWPIMTAEEKHRVLRRLAARKAVGGAAR